MQRSLPPTMMPSLSQTASHSSMLWVVSMTLREAAREDITSHMDLHAGPRRRQRQPEEGSVVVDERSPRTRLLAPGKATR